jgi:hypothetical protein
VEPPQLFELHSNAVSIGHRLVATEPWKVFRWVVSAAFENRLQARKDNSRRTAFGDSSWPKAVRLSAPVAHLPSGIDFPRSS